MTPLIFVVANGLITHMRLLHGHGRRSWNSTSGQSRSVDGSIDRPLRAIIRMHISVLVKQALLRTRVLCTRQDTDGPEMSAPWKVDEPFKG